MRSCCWSFRFCWAKANVSSRRELRHANSRWSARRLWARASSSVPTSRTVLCAPAPTPTQGSKPRSSPNLRNSRVPRSSRVCLSGWVDFVSDHRISHSFEPPRISGAPGPAADASEPRLASETGPRTWGTRPMHPCGPQGAKAQIVRLRWLARLKVVPRYKTGRLAMGRTGGCDSRNPLIRTPANKRGTRPPGLISAYRAI